MTRNFIIIFCLILWATAANAQSAVAKIKYEQAEEAYVKNDFQTTLLKLEEVEKILGSVNPKLLYLRFMAQKGIISRGNFDGSLLKAALQTVQ